MPNNAGKVVGQVLTWPADRPRQPTTEHQKIDFWSDTLRYRSPRIQNSGHRVGHIRFSDPEHARSGVHTPCGQPRFENRAGPHGKEAERRGPRAIRRHSQSNDRRSEQAENRGRELAREPITFSTNTFQSGNSDRNCAAAAESSSAAGSISKLFATTYVAGFATQQAAVVSEQLMVCSHRGELITEPRRIGRKVHSDMHLTSTIVEEPE